MLAISDNDKGKPVNGMDASTLARFIFLTSGLFTFIIGWVGVGEVIGSLVTCAAPQTCVGPALFWTDFQSRDANAGWRGIFSLNPESFTLYFTPIVMGGMTMLVHMDGFELVFMTRIWIYVSFWLLLMALFGNFGYAGNLGVIVGCYTSLGATVTFFLALLNRKEATTFHFQVWHSRFFDCVVDNALVIFVARVLSLGIGLMTLVIGLMHVFLTNFKWCPGNGATECFGPSVRWNTVGGQRSFIYHVNQDQPGWMTIFTFVPSIIGPLWGPAILGFITAMQHLEGHMWPTIFMSWPRCVIWFTFIALFANFGYVGNLGIVIGFISIFQAFLGVLITIGGGATTTTHFNFTLHYRRGGV